MENFKIYTRVGDQVMAIFLARFFKIKHDFPLKNQEMENFERYMRVGDQDIAFFGKIFTNKTRFSFKKLGNGELRKIYEGWRLGHGNFFLHETRFSFKKIRKWRTSKDIRELEIRSWQFFLARFFKMKHGFPLKNYKMENFERYMRVGDQDIAFFWQDFHK